MKYPRYEAYEKLATRRMPIYIYGVIRLTRTPRPLTLGDLLDKRVQVQEIVSTQP
jgi:hypothetical protein